MNTHVFMLVTVDELQKAAKLLSKSADVMAETRRATMATITPGEFKLSILRENSMRDAVNSILLSAIDGALKDVKGSQSDLEEAIVEATEIVKKIDNIKRAFEIFATLIGLAQAIASGVPSAILKGFKAMRTAVKNS